MRILKKAFTFCCLLGLASINIQCKGEKKGEKIHDAMTEIKSSVTITKESFGITEDSITVERFNLRNEKGMEVSIITYGGIITSLKVPNRNNVVEDVVLGFDSLKHYTSPEYLKGCPFFGALIGRYGNRIAKGKFSLDGAQYQLETNDGENHLHGGVKGFDKVVWLATETKSNGTSASVVLSYVSKDMEGGYPGNLNTLVTYTLSNENILDVKYEATTDKKTIVNLTQHSYFNLSGDSSKSILNHEITIDADKFIPVDATLIPTGELKDVTNTPFDFRVAKTIAQDINVKDEQLKRGLGYDHCWVLNNQDKGMRLAASAYHRGSGRLLEVFTDEPGIQLYTGNFLNGTFPNKQGGTYNHRAGFCLETQHYPDTPNQKGFPSVVLNPGETYVTTTSFKFSTK